MHKALQQSQAKSIPLPKDSVSILNTLKTKCYWTNKTNPNFHLCSKPPDISNKALNSEGVAGGFATHGDGRGFWMAKHLLILICTILPQRAHLSVP